MESEISTHTPIAPTLTSPPSGDPDDDILLARIAQGDHPAYALLVERYLKKLWRLAINVLHNEAEAEDIVQDVLLTIWRTRGKWEAGGQARFSTWIYRVTLNRCIDQKRKRATTNNTVELDDTLPSESELPADRRMIQGQENRKLRQLLEELPDKQRQAIMLFYYQDLTIPEICHRLNTTEMSVRSLLKRARKTLKGRLGHATTDDDDTGDIQGEP